MLTGYDRPWRPIGLVHISSISAERVTDVESFVTEAIGPVGTRVVVAIRSTKYNARKRISLDMMRVLLRSDQRPVAWVHQLPEPSLEGAEPDSSPQPASSAIFPDWLATARASLPSPRVGRNSARRWAAWPSRQAAAQTAAETAVADAEDTTDQAEDRADRKKSVIYRNRN
mmetsp:Transcript_29133/g.66868  ORF Transcript_29133/g.66868 Transcript_29133/m.66868 type:complete len:171 (+) Transcript_29133:168-680(+)